MPPSLDGKIFIPLTSPISHRTHRERKELYIKALEDEVLRLKELYSNISQDKEICARENRLLKEMLAQHGIRYSRGHGQDDAASLPSLGHPSSTTSPGDGFAPTSYTAFSPEQSATPSVASTGRPGYLPPTVGDRTRSAVQVNGEAGDLEQAGIDFVLTYDNSASSRAYLSPPPL